MERRAHLHSFTLCEKNAVNAEQDIVLKAQGSSYTNDMETADDERDALYSLIHHKLMAMALYPAKSAMATLKAPLQKYILGKYNTDIVALPYQEESAHLSGFLMDLHAQFSDDDLEVMGVTNDLLQLKAANDRFAALYNQRAMERSATRRCATRAWPSSAATGRSMDCRSSWNETSGARHENIARSECTAIGRADR